MYDRPLLSRERIMIKMTNAVALILLFLGGLFVTPSYAGVPRYIVAEEFGATW